MQSSELDAEDQKILAGLPRLLAAGGIALLEIGQGQDAALTGMAAVAGFAVSAREDLGGVVRCLQLAPSIAAPD